MYLWASLSAVYIQANLDWKVVAVSSVSQDDIHGPNCYFKTGEFLLFSYK
jgi:hypothetical protein